MSGVAAEDLLLAFGSPLVLLEPSGLILRANGSANRLLGNHPAFSGEMEYFTLRRAEEAQRLSDALQAVCRDRQTAVFVTLAARSGRPVMMLRLAAVGERQDGPILCEIEDLVAPMQNSVGLAAAMGITVAQARVAALLARGLSVPEIAAELGVTQATLRTHIRLATSRLGLEGQQALAVCTAQMARFSGMLQTWHELVG